MKIKQLSIKHGSTALPRAPHTAYSCAFLQYIFKAILTRFSKCLQVLEHGIFDGLIPALFSPVIGYDAKRYS